MSVIIKTKIGAQMVECHGRDLKEAITEASLLSELPSKCGNCNKENLAFRHRRAQGQYDFYSLRCRDCAWEFSIGERKDDKALFPKWDEGWKPPFQSSNHSTNQTSQPPQQQGGYQQQPTTQPSYEQSQQPAQTGQSPQQSHHPRGAGGDPY